MYKTNLHNTLAVSLNRFRIQLLEEIYSCQILLLLYANGRMFRTQIYNELGTNNKSMAARIAMLRDMGLVRETVETAPPYRVYIELSDKGGGIAEHLDAIEELLNS